MRKFTVTVNGVAYDVEINDGYAQAPRVLIINPNA